MWETYRDCFLDFSLSLRFFLFEVYNVEGYSNGGLTTHNLSSLPGFAFFLFCNQLASARLVIRRAVEIGSPRFVGCSWFIGLIGLDTELPKINLILDQYAPHFPHMSPLASSH